MAQSANSSGAVPSPVHAVNILVDKNYIDVSSLMEKAGDTAFLELKWIASARSNKATYILANGNHRHELLKSYHCAKLLERIEKLKKEKAKYMEKGAMEIDSHIKVLNEDINKLQGVLRLSGIWLAKVYDISEHPFFPTDPELLVTLDHFSCRYHKLLQ